MQSGTHRRGRFLVAAPVLVAIMLIIFQSCGGGDSGEVAGQSDVVRSADSDSTGQAAAADPSTDPAESDQGAVAESDPAVSGTATAETATAEGAGDDGAESPAEGREAAPVRRATATGGRLLTVRQSSTPVFDVRSLEGTVPLDSKQAYMDYMLANTNEDERYLSQRWDRAQVAIGYGDFQIDRIREAFLLTPREHFAREWNSERVYDHAYLGIGYGQTISGPHIVITMTESLNPQPDHKVLEIGTGSGYQSAFLSRLSNHVYTIEIVEPLATSTDEIYSELTDEYPMYGNVSRKVDDGYYGWEEFAPFDKIIVTAGIDHIPPDLIRQLAPGGTMVIPVGPPSGQTILAVTKVVEEDGLVRLLRDDIYDGRLKDVFVPFTSSEGGTHNRAE